MHFTIIYAFLLTLTETVIKYALCCQCGCHVYVGINELHRHMRLTEQWQRKGGELEIC